MVIQILSIILLVIALGMPLIIIIESTRALWREKTGRAHILLKGLMALAIWFVVSYGTMFMVFVTFWGTAHSEYAWAHNGAHDPSGSDSPTGMIFLIFVIYTLIAAAISYWLLPRAKVSFQTSENKDQSKDKYGNYDW
jgi:uncharacterized BrkB/YihY/UPF0761 family membrane protein